MPYIASVLGGYEEFTQSGVFRKRSDARYVYVELVGGGQGGFSTTANNSANGGSGGNVSRRMFLLSDLPDEVAITIGSGGGGGAQPGGDTQFGSFLKSPGGGKGTRPVTGGDGGSAQGRYPGGDGEGGGGGGRGTPLETGEFYVGGTSTAGNGDGGAGGNRADPKRLPTAGQFPGGGGGGAGGLNTSGAPGAAGIARIWQW